MITCSFLLICGLFFNVTLPDAHFKSLWVLGMYCTLGLPNPWAMDWYQAAACFESGCVAEGEQAKLLLRMCWIQVAYETIHHSSYREKLFSMKLFPVAKKVGDHCCTPLRICHIPNVKLPPIYPFLKVFTFMSMCTFLNSRG